MQSKNCVNCFISNMLEICAMNSVKVLCRRDGVSILDLEPILNNRVEEFFCDGIHLSAVGHQESAWKIYLEVMGSSFSSFSQRIK